METRSNVGIESGESIKPRRDLDDVIDELGYGLAQYLLLFCGGSVMILSGALKLLPSLLVAATAMEWSLSSAERGMLVSVLFIGNMIGNVLSGVFADRWGRRLPLLLAFALTTFFSLGSVFASGFWSLLAWRVAVGVGLGFSSSPWCALAGEMCPSYARMELAAGGMIMFCIGMNYALALIWWQDPAMKNLDWRWLTVIAAAPGLIFTVIAYLFLPESLRYLDRKACRSEVVALLSRIRDLNRRHEVDVYAWETSEALEDAGLKALWSTRALRQTLFTLCFSTFTLNYAYYGEMYALPQVLPNVELGVSPTTNMLIATFVEISGYILGVFVSRRVSRKSLLLMYLSGLATCISVFCVALHFTPGPTEAVLAHHALIIRIVNGALSGSKLCISIGWLVVYVYAVEVYPTSCRAFGSAVSVAAGRFGSICCPLMYEFFQVLFGTHHGFFGVMVGCTITNAVLVMMLPVETKDRKLGEIASETQSVLLCKSKK